MKTYNQSQLFQVLVSQALSPDFIADAELQARYNKQRATAAEKALRTRNVFLYTEGTRTSTDLNNANTIYTQATGLRLMVLGYSNNLRYGAAVTGGPSAAALYLQEHRIRVVGPNGERNNIAQDWMPGQAGVAGEPRYTEARLTAPFILEPNEQIAVDLGYDTAGGTTPSNVPPEAFIFFCVYVKEQLTADDLDVLADIKRFIDLTTAQRTMILNCVVLGQAGVGLTTASVAGDITRPETQPAPVPILITGIGTTLGASKLTITDTRDGTSFSLNRAMQSSALCFPGYEDADDAVAFGAPAMGPIWSSYYRLPMPHLLVRGAQLKAEIVNGADAGAGAGTVTEQGALNQLVFFGVTV